MKCLDNADKMGTTTYEPTDHYEIYENIIKYADNKDPWITIEALLPFTFTKHFTMRTGFKNFDIS